MTKKSNKIKEAALSRPDGPITVGIGGGYVRDWENKQRISTGVVESTVNAVVSKRFAKKQQMQWSKQGAYDLLQARSRVL